MRYRRGGPKKSGGTCQWPQTCAGQGTYTVRSNAGPGHALRFKVCAEHRDLALSQGYHLHEPSGSER